MFTRVSTDFHRGVSAVIAVAIVGISGLVIDQSHVRAARGGIDQVEALRSAELLPGVTALPEVVVTATRL